MKRGLTNLKLMYLGTVMAFFSSVGIFSELTEKASCVCGFFFFYIVSVTEVKLIYFNI